MKHIKVRAKVCRDKEYFDMEVIQVTHEHYDTFAGGQELDTSHSRRLFIHGTVGLAYNCANAFTEEAWGLESWYPPNKASKVIDILIVVYTGGTVPMLPSAKWPAIREAIEAYNAFYADKE